MQNLPIPNVQVIDDHSYISIKECVTNFLLSGKMPKSQTYLDMNQNKIECITQSIAAHQIYQKAHAINAQYKDGELIIILRIQWSDDYDPNSAIKSNRGSIWVETVTFISEDFGGK